MKRPAHAVGRMAFRLYATAYVGILSFGLLSGPNGDAALAAEITPRAAALVGLGLCALVAWVARAGRTAVALRVTAAEAQFRLLTPITKRRALRRQITNGVIASAVGAAAVTLAVMSAFPTQLSGLTLRAEIGYALLAAMIGVAAFSAQLLVAARRGSPLALAGIAVATTCAVDAIENTQRSPFVAAIRMIRRGDLSSLAIAAAAALTVVAVGVRSVERIPIDRIVGSSAASDGAAVAIAGNDVRALLLIIRSMGDGQRRASPAFRLPRSLVYRYPVFTRDLRGMARWPLRRLCLVVTMAFASSLLLATSDGRLEPTALASIVLWAFGLTINEAFGLEHDHADRLALVPSSRRIELAHIGFGWLATFVLISVPLAVSLSGDVSVVMTLSLAAAAAGAATTSSVISLRSRWRLLLDPVMIGLPTEAIAFQALLKLTKPVLVSLACLSGWHTGGAALAVAGPAAIAVAAVFVLVGTNLTDRVRQFPWMAIG